MIAIEFEAQSHNGIVEYLNNTKLGETKPYALFC